MPGFRLQIFFGVAAPAKTPPAIVREPRQEIKAVTAMPEVQQRMAKVGLIPAMRTAAVPEPADGRPKRYGEVIRAAGIQPNRELWMHVIIVGGGIFGLSLALSLHQIGMSCRV